MKKITKIMTSPFAALPIVILLGNLYIFVKFYGDGWRAFEGGLTLIGMYLAWIIYRKTSFMNVLEKFGWFCLLQILISASIQYCYLYIFNDYSLSALEQSEWGSTIAKSAMARKTSYYFYLLPFFAQFFFFYMAVFRGERKSDRLNFGYNYIAFMKPCSLRGKLLFIFVNAGSISYVVNGEHYCYILKNGVMRFGRQPLKNIEKYNFKRVPLTDRHIRYITVWNQNEKYGFFRNCLFDYFRFRMPLAWLF
jgi:hypothetical protein